jgi:hypothetical protein
MAPSVEGALRNASMPIWVNHGVMTVGMMVGQGPGHRGGLARRCLDQAGRYQAETGPDHYPSSRRLGFLAVVADGGRTHDGRLERFRVSSQPAGLR